MTWRERERDVRDWCYMQLEASDALRRCRYLEKKAQDGSLERRAVPRLMSSNSLTLDSALEVFKWTDISLGLHPDTGLDMFLKSGRFGKYYEHGALSTSVGRVAEGFEPNLEHAITRLDTKAKRLGASICATSVAYPKGAHACVGHLLRQRATMRQVVNTWAD